MSGIIEERRRLRSLTPTTAEHVGLFAVLTTELPHALEVGRGAVIHVEGWIHHPGATPRSVAVRVGQRYEPVRALFRPTPHALLEHFGSVDVHRAEASTAFAALVPLKQIEHSQTVEVELELAGRDRSASRLPLGTVELKPGASVQRPQRSGEQVGICMATFNPVLALFERQVESLVNQSHKDWLCVVADDGSDAEVADALRSILAKDARFTFAHSEERLGFYRNFERALTLLPPEVDFVGLCDHDDYWHADKIATLLERFDRDTTLVYSDMNIATPEGKILSPTYWTTRANNHTNLTTLLLANTVTGASCLFRASLLDDLLPFPPVIGQPYHDHWIASCSLAFGKIGYVDRPLYDYVQHTGNVIGHYAPVRSWRQKAAVLVAAFRRDANEAIKRILSQWRAIYLWDVLRIESIALTIELRGGSRVSRRKQSALQRLAQADRSLAALPLLWIRSFNRIGRTTQTLGAERAVARGIVWRRLTWAKSRARASRR